MQYRNYLKKDPFSAAKQYIQLRLQTLQQAILSKFKHGPEREMMRVTIKQLLNVEPSLQGKINRLMTVIQQIEICGNNYFDTMDSQCQVQLNKEKCQNKDVYTQYNLISPKRDEKYSNLSQSRRYRQRDLIDRYEDNYASKKHYPTQFQAYQIPYSYNSVKNKQQYTENSISSLHSSKSSNNLTMPNFLNKSDSINQHDLFSFRTQEAASPLKRSKQSPLRKKSQPFQQNPYDYLYKQQKSRSQSQKKSIPKSQKSSQSRKNSKTKEKKSLNKSINYDGKGINFKARTFETNKKVKRQNSLKNSSIKQLNQAQVLKKIQKRIKFSKCVVDQIQHSNSNANQLYFVNRFKQENQLRKKLCSQIQDFVNNCGRWR